MDAADDGRRAWRPTATLSRLRLRAGLLARVRDYFATHGCARSRNAGARACAGDRRAPRVAARRGRCRSEARRPGYLHTSPEYAMKRLLCAGAPDIYQVCRVFRAGERGGRHNPEFTMIEWYRLGLDHHALMRDVEALIRAVLESATERSQPSEYVTYRAAFERRRRRRSIARDGSTRSWSGDRARRCVAARVDARRSPRAMTCSTSRWAPLVADVVRDRSPDVPVRLSREPGGARAHRRRGRVAVRGLLGTARTGQRFSRTRRRRRTAAALRGGRRARRACGGQPARGRTLSSPRCVTACRLAPGSRSDSIDS